MMTSARLCIFAIIAALAAGAPALLSAQQGRDAGIRVGDSDLGGVVTGANGPEAGVWVVAETSDLPTKFAKMVVTDDQGRYLLPELPKANYRVWVRGYGLVDSPTVETAPGKILNLRAVPAPNEAAAAQYYPAIYWWSMLKVPDKSDFPGTGQSGNGIRRTCARRATGSPASRPTAASAATRWATSRRARSRRSSASSILPIRPGSGACSPGRQARS